MKYPFDCISDFVFVDMPLEPADVILVPGSSKPQAIRKAAKLYHLGFAPYILPSGGFNSKLEQPPSEWEYLRQTAMQLGVPDKAILKEDKAANTFDNARLSLQTLREQDIPFKNAILVCKAYHSRRALLTYQAVFPKDTVFHVCAVPDYRGMQKDNWFTREEWIPVVMGEVVKIGKYFGKYIPELMAKAEE